MNDKNLLKLLRTSNIEIYNEVLNQIINQKNFDISLLTKPKGISEAIILQKKGYLSCVPYTIDLLEWYQDMNWDGVMQINELLHTYPDEILAPYFEETVRLAFNDNNPEWLYFLNLYLGDKITEEHFVDKELYLKFINFFKWYDNQYSP